ncbi:MAG: VCBS repeat-containing protein [Sedimentisphaerales bacterium]|nr:VCBS repeat-containing protein [Sedimentisphaerales bacterium]
MHAVLLSASKYYRWLFFSILSFLCVLSAKPCAANDIFQNVLDQFSLYDNNSDGRYEIETLERLFSESADTVVPTDSRLVVVMVEQRLLNEIPGSAISVVDVNERLKRFRGDLQAEGYSAEFVAARVYAGYEHQDGRTVIALREFLKSVRVTYNNLAGVIFVGSFPEPMLVRRWLWPRVTEEGGMQIGGIDLPAGIEYLRIVPEIVSERSDLVIADLDGRWDAIYEKGPMNLESIVARPNVTGGADWYQNGQILFCPQYDRTSLSFQDFFWIKDDNYSVISSGEDGMMIQIFTEQLHPEMTLSDKKRPNPLAKPEIFVSRINPLHIAVNPDPNFRDDYGQGFLGADGRPQAVNPSEEIDLSIYAFWHRDPNLERKILIDYFDRDHNYRVGGDSYLPFQTAAIGKDLSAAALNDNLIKASSEFVGSIVKENASLRTYVSWLKETAVYRGIIAHSNCFNSAFGSYYALENLDELIGERPWRWKRKGDTYLYEPNLADQGGTADLYVHRTIWENGILEGTGSRLYIHCGCQANSPYGADTRAYNNSLYGTFQNVEGVLFYLNGVALTARAKVFYDSPRGFSEAFGLTERSCFGDGWKGYFNEEAKDTSLPAMVADNKRCYTWSVLGDWTVRLRCSNGLGIVGLADGVMTDYAVHPDNAWIGEWDYCSALNEVEGTGDFNADGKPDIILTSSWGLCLVSHDGTSWKQIAIHPKYDWLGAWRYNSDDNTIEGTGDFDGNKTDDILVTSPWGIGIIKYQDSALTSMVAEASGAVFGDWQYDIKSDVIQGIGDFDGNGRDDILISNSSAIGILAVHSSSLLSIMNQPKGAWFGGWCYNPDDNVIQGIADFNGDGKDDILMTSPWGIGIFTLQNSTLVPIIIHSNGMWFGGWRYNSDDNVIEGMGDINGDGQDDLVMSSPWGIAVLKLQNDTLATVLLQAKGTWFGGWLYNPDNDTIVQIADFNGDTREDILISSEWGIGILTLAGDTFTSLDMAAYECPVGAWYLTETDRVCDVVRLGNGQGFGILLKK